MIDTHEYLEISSEKQGYRTGMVEKKKGYSSIRSYACISVNSI